MYEKKILDAIQILVDNSLDKASFNKTIRGIISKCIDEKTGKYVVIYQDSSFYAYSNDLNQIYSAGTPVYILIPNNDMAQTKTILGSVNKLGSDYINTIEEINKYDIIGNNILSMENEVGICSYKNGGDALILYNKLDTLNSLVDIDITAAETYIKQSSYLVLGGSFRTNLPKEQRYKGVYGLGVDLNFIDNITGEPVKRTYLVNVNNMLGNPYEFTRGSEQKVVFNIDGTNFSDIDKIYLYCYDFPNTSEEEKPNDIFISSLIMNGATPLTQEELAGNKLSLITPQGIYFSSADSGTTKKTIKTEVRIDNKLVDKDSSLLRYYWFQEDYSINSSSLLYHRYGGQGWKCLNNYNVVEKNGSNIPTLVDWITNQNNFSIRKTDVVAYSTDYKCVVVYNNEIVLTKTFTIYNYGSNYIISIESDEGTSFSYDNGKPTLTCSVNQEDDYEYAWGVIDSGNNFSLLQETTSINTAYHNTKSRFDEIQSGLADGSIVLTAALQQELNQLTYSLEQYKTIMRIEDNQIINLKLNTITNFATFICAVYKNNVYIGKGKIKITNELNTQDNSYTLVINNGNQIFKYNEDGISPASKALENPQEIYPLSFTLYDEKGNEIDNASIDAKKVFWTVPSENTMINISPVHGNPISIDEINKTKTYTEYKQLFFDIPTLYQSGKARNTIQLEVKYKDKNIKAKVDILFIKEGESGSNGTNFVCRIVPNMTNESAAPIYPIVTYDNNAEAGTQNPTINFTPDTENVWFKAQLFKNGERIFNGPVSAQSTENRAVDVKWEILTNKYDATHSDISNFTVNASTGVFTYNSLSAIEDNILKNSPSNIVKCTLTYDNVKYIATMPIIVVKVNNSAAGAYRADIVENSGFRYVMYSTDGRKPLYNNSIPFALKIYETVDNIEQDISITTIENLSINYTWFVSGALWNGSAWVAETNLVEKVHNIANPLAKNEKDYKPIDTYNGLNTNNGLRCVITRQGTQLMEIFLPIHFYLNRYGNAALNEWDGNHIAIDEDGGFILSPQIGAGRKEQDNSYTGLFMGEVREAGESDSTTGLFGYNHGERTLLLNSEDGSARFGKTGQGQIVIDPGINSAKLYSDDYSVDYVRPSDMIPAQTKYVAGYSYWRKNGNDYILLKSLDDYIEGYYYNEAFYEDVNHTTLITPVLNQKYYDLTNKKCYKYIENSYEELTNYYKNGDSIKSTDWVWANGEGLEIDLNDPHIRFGSGKFRVDSDGQVYATGFVNVIDLENGDYNIPGTNNFQVEYPVEDIQFETNVKYYPTSTITKSISCKCLYKDQYTNDYTLNLIDNQGNVITHNTASDGIAIAISKSGNVSTISFSVDRDRKILSTINDYLFRFTYTPTGETIDKIFGANLIIRGNSITVKGSYDSLQDLLDDVSDGIVTPTEGDSYVIDEDLYVYTNDGRGYGTLAADWDDVGRFVGESAKQCILTTTNEAFKSIDGGTTYSPNNVTITPFFQNVNYSSWAYSTDGGANYTTISTMPSGISMDNATKALTVSKDCTLFNTNSVLVFKCSTDENGVYDTRTIMKIKDGVNGVDGYSIWTTTTAPTTPNYTFTIANLVGPSGKMPAVGEIIIQSNRYQYTISEVSTATVKANSRVDLKGADGNNGNNTATINLYGRFASAPSKPYTESVTYTFSTQALSSIPTGWSKSVPAIDGNKKLYISSAVAYGNTASVAIGKDSWSTPVAIVENGADGENPTFITCGNEAQTIVCDASGAVISDTLITIPFAGYIGNSRAACSVSYGTLPGESGEVVLVSNTAATTSADGSLVLKVNATATLGNITNGVIDLTFTCNSKTFVKKFNWAKALTGTAGYNTVTVNLYKRGTNPSSLGAPYSTSATYTFATQSLSPAPSNNWSVTIPEGTDPLYICSAIAYSNTASDGIAAADWSSPSRIMQNGADGGNTAIVNLYQRASTTPSAISTSTTYTFADQSLSPLPTGWSQTVPTDDGNPLYITSAIAYGNSSSVTIVSTKWSSPVKMVENGLDGESVVVDTTTIEYKSSTSGSIPPSGTWSLTPSPVAGQYLWTRTTTTYKLSSSQASAGSSISYSVAYIGEDGDTGARGTGIWTTTVAPTTPNYTFTISNLTGMQGTPIVGDTIIYSYYKYTITSVSTTTVLAGTRVSIRGATGASSRWYTGTNITGTSSTATIFPNSGISSAVVGDMYLNTDTQNTYRCTVAGAANAAKWVYVSNIEGDDGVGIISITPLHYLKTTSGAPAKPSSHVTSTSTATNVWTLAVPTYETGATYYTCNEIYFDNNTYSWTDVVADSGINTAIVKANTAENQSGHAVTVAEAAQGAVNTLASRVIDVSNTVIGSNQVTLENAYEGGLHKLQIWGQINILFPGDDVYPSETLYPTFLPILSVDTTDYLLDINYLNYLSAEVYDEFVYEEGNCKIIRRVGNDNGTLYALNQEVEEERNGIKIAVKKNSTIRLKYFSNMSYKVQYLLDNEYTNSFTTNLDLVSRINVSPEQIEISSNKINLNGWVSANQNFWITNDGDMHARNGSFSGDIFLENNGKVIGGDGLLTNLQYSSFGIINGWGPIGFTTSDTGTTLYQDLVVDYFIPDNFTITEAYLTLYTTRVMSSYNSGGSLVETTGIPKQLKLYNGMLNKTYKIYWTSGSSYFYRQDLGVSTEISNAFGSATYTPSIVSVGEVANVTTIDLSNDGTFKQKGNKQLIIRSTVSKPAAYTQAMAESTGAGRAMLNIIGYMSTNPTN